MDSLLQHPTSQHLLSATLGALGMWLFGLWRHKTTVINYAVHVERLGVSANDEVFGSVQLQWQERPVPNLYFATVTLDNPTLRDVVDLHIHAYVSVGTRLLTQRTQVEDSPLIVLLDPTYLERVLPPAGTQASPAQLREWATAREYRLPVLNRGQRVRLTYLCSWEGEQAGEPMVYVDGRNSGLKFVRSSGAISAFGVPIRAAQWLGLAVALALTGAVAVKTGDIWLTAAVALAVGLVAQLIGAATYRCIRWVQKLVAG